MQSQQNFPRRFFFNGLRSTACSELTYKTSVFFLPFDFTDIFRCAAWVRHLIEAQVFLFFCFSFTHSYFDMFKLSFGVEHTAVWTWKQHKKNGRFRDSFFTDLKYFCFHGGLWNIVYRRKSVLFFCFFTFHWRISAKRISRLSSN